MPLRNGNTGPAFEVYDFDQVGSALFVRWPENKFYNTDGGNVGGCARDTSGC